MDVGGFLFEKLLFGNVVRSFDGCLGETSSINIDRLELVKIKSPELHREFQKAFIVQLYDEFVMTPHESADHALFCNEVRSKLDEFRYSKKVVDSLFVSEFNKITKCQI